MFHFFRELQPYRQQLYHQSFRKSYLVTVLFMMALIVVFNYYPLPGFTMPAPGAPHRFVISYLLYLIPFATAFMLQVLFLPAVLHLKSKWLWLVILIAPAVFSFRIN